MLKLESPGKMQIGLNGFIISVVNRAGLLMTDLHDLMIWVDDKERTQVPLGGLDRELLNLNTEQVLDVIEFVRAWDRDPRADLPLMAVDLQQLVDSSTKF